MKKILLGSTALATAGLMAAPVAASELSVTISGHLNTGFYVINADDNVTNAYDGEFVRQVHRPGTAVMGDPGYIMDDPGYIMDGDGNRIRIPASVPRATVLLNQLHPLNQRLLAQGVAHDDLPWRFVHAVCVQGGDFLPVTSPGFRGHNAAYHQSFIADTPAHNYGWCEDQNTGARGEPVSIHPDLLRINRDSRPPNNPDNAPDEVLYYTQTVENAPERTDEYSQNQAKLGSGEINIKAEGTLENGMQVGGEVVLEAFEGSDARDLVDEHYIYVNGGFGRLVLGGIEGAAYQMHYSSPWFVPGNGVDSPNFYNISRTSVRTNTYAQMSGNAIKLSYFTPRIAGFQLGTSYTPNNRDVKGLRNSFGLQTTEGAGSDGLENIYDVGVSYTRRFKAQGYYAVDFALSAGYETGSSNITGAEDPVNWTVGGALAWRALTFGGAYYYGENQANTIHTGDRETTAWTAGVAWNRGPWSAGVAYFDAEEEGGMRIHRATDQTTIRRHPDDPDITEPVALGASRNTFLQVGGSYALGRGVDIGVEVQLIKDDNGGNPNNNGRFQTQEIKSTSGGVVMNISF
ncbi:MAG: porin [Parvularculales bacterium]